MTPAELRAIEERAEAATPGPWSEDDGNVFSTPLSERRHEIIMRRIHGEDIPHPDHDEPHPMGFVCTTTQETANFDNNADFIAHARTDVPRLVAEVRRLEVVLALDRECRLLNEAELHRADALVGAATQRAERAEAVVQAALGWVHDTGDCHFCGFGQHRDEHDDGCPLAALDATPAAGGPSISAPICPCNLDGPCVRGCSATPANETRGHGHE